MSFGDSNFFPFLLFFPLGPSTMDTRLKLKKKTSIPVRTGDIGDETLGFGFGFFCRSRIYSRGFSSFGVEYEIAT